jgi:hypothetical protein
MVETTLLDRVKAFLIRLVKDSGFATQLSNLASDQVQQVLKDLGYSFSQEEFETASIQILELKERDEFHDLTETELVGAVGGWMQRFPRRGSRPSFYRPPFSQPPLVQPMYGVIIDPPDDYVPLPAPNPLPDPLPQPMYGVVIDPPVTIQPLYGVVI